MGAPTGEQARRPGGRAVELRLVNGQHRTEILEREGLQEVAGTTELAARFVVAGEEELAGRQRFIPLLFEETRWQDVGAGDERNPAPRGDSRGFNRV